MAKIDTKKAVKVGTPRRVLDSLTGAKLCFGAPVVHADRTVIPVARVQGAGGYGFGGDVSGDTGGGGGGWLDARPVGFVEIGPDGTRYERIPDPDRLARTLKAGAGALAAVIAGVAGARQLERGPARRSPRALLRR